MTLEGESRTVARSARERVARFAAAASAPPRRAAGLRSRRRGRRRRRSRLGEGREGRSRPGSLQLEPRHCTLEPVRDLREVLARLGDVSHGGGLLLTTALTSCDVAAFCSATAEIASISRARASASSRCASLASTMSAIASRLLSISVEIRVSDAAMCG